MINEKCLCGHGLEEIYKPANGGAYIAECGCCGKRYDELSYWKLKEYKAIP